MKKLLLALILLQACDDDGEVEEQDASLQISADGGDARALDAAADVFRYPDANTARCRVDQRYEFALHGGLVSYADAYVLEEFTLTKTRDAFQSSAPTSCTAVIESCYFPDRIDAGHLRIALANPDVLAAFSSDAEVLGRDTRPVDGQVLVITRADGKEIQIGDACEGVSGCTPIPAGVEALRIMLLRLMREHDGDPARADANGRCPD